MQELKSYLECLSTDFSKTFIKLLGIVSQSILCCRGRVTMLGLSRWSGKGGSYRSIQRFYGSTVDWLNLNWLFFKTHRFRKEEVYLLTGDETTVTKAGKKTYGLGRFFSSVHGKAVKGLGFLSLCLVGVSSKQAVPWVMEPLEAQMKKETRGRKKQKTGQGKRGRPQGSKNRNQANRELTPYLQWMKGTIQRTLSLIGSQLKILYFVYDGAFGNSACLQMVKECGLFLISKLQCRAALWFPYEGEYGGKGARRKYGDKVNYGNLPQKYLKKLEIEEGVEERIYQMTVWHRDFQDMLNVIILQKKQIQEGKVGQVILFSNDLHLSWDKMLLYYRLRFQIEFTFRDAKQFWGLEDFMNINATPVKNAANFSMFMVNLSRFLTENETLKTEPSILDLKMRFQTAFYLEQIFNNHPEIRQFISFEQLQNKLSDLGCVHAQSELA